MQAAGRERGTERLGSIDLVVIALALCFLGVLAFLRRDYNEDGLRHFHGAITSARPSFGTTRWLLFPVALWLVERPFVLVGFATTIERAELVFSGVSWTCGAVYLFAVRRWLIARGVDVTSRAVALLLVCSLPPFLIMTTDNFEPTIAVTIGIAGLSFAAARAGDPARVRAGLFVALGCISLAGLVYQATILSIGFLPLAIPPVTLRALLREARTVVVSFALLAAMPVVAIVLTALQGDTLVHTAIRFARGDESVLYRGYGAGAGQADHGPVKLLMAVLLGPAANVSSTRHQGGMRDLLALIASPAQRLEGLEDVALLAFGLVVMVTTVVAMIRRRDAAWLFGLGVLLLLPLVRTQQWSYTKFYLMLPALLALAAPAFRPRVVACVAIALLARNGRDQILSVREGRAFYDEFASFYPTLPPNPCFLAGGWGPPIGEDWTGRSVPFLGTLSAMISTADHASDDPLVAARSTAAIADRTIEACFCDSSIVLTDEFTAEGVPHLRATASTCHYDDIDFHTLLWTPEAAMEVPALPNGIHAYSRESQARICDAVQRQLASSTRSAGGVSQPPR